jgi:hypothetical protein
VARAVSLRLLFTRAYRYRRALLRRMAFAGVTGSAGKTTSKELLAARVRELAGVPRPGRAKRDHEQVTMPCRASAPAALETRVAKG